jgi:6-phosphogluconolactonase
MKIRSFSTFAYAVLLVASCLISQTSSAQASGGGRPEFAYAVDQDSNTVLGFSVDSAGALTPLSTPSFPTGSVPTGVAVDPRGRFVYVANVVSNDVSGYAIAEDGTLTPVPGSPFAAGSGPGWVTVDPTGRFVYVANCAALCSGAGSGSVSGYAIDRTTGALTPVPGSPFVADDIPYAVVVDSTGEFAYVANFRAATVSVFRIDHTSGSLTSTASPIPTGGSNSLYLAVDPHGRFLYVVNTGSGNVSAFAVGDDGMLTAVPGSPFPTGEFTGGVAFDRSGEFLYVTAGFQVLGFSIQKGGVLAPLATSPFPAPGFLVSLTLDRTGQHLFAAASFAGVAAFDISPETGALTAVSGAPFPAGADTTFVATSVGH